MRTLLLITSAIALGSELPAQVRIQSAPEAFAYVMGDPDRPMIGISTRNSGKRDSLGLMVDAVTRGGPAEKAGIEEGDRLVSVNSVNLRLSPSDAGEPDMDGVANRRLVRELEKKKAGDEVELRVYRDGNTRTVRVATVAAEDLNKEVYASTSGGAWRVRGADRAVLGISLGGNGSRRDTLGIMVVSVTDSGPAAKAGIDEGDRVAAINGVDLRVASEDAGDAQASSARINRLNREMEKVKAGDAVELRVYSGGQVRTVRVEAAKASDVHGEGFFFNGSGARALTMPRAVRVRPPMIEFNDAVTRAELETKLRSLQGTLRSSIEPAMKLRDQLKAEAMKKVSIARYTSIL